MGLYIPDLRLPADGDFELWIAVRKDGSFTYNVRGDWQNEKQRAVPVPEPHGRLIDADKLMKRMWDETDCMISVPATFVRDAPTVIPASEEGEV